jgi:hypothetical protein
MRVKKSRPRSSTPNQNSAEGKANAWVRKACCVGSVLVKSGARIAASTRIASTMPPPMAALLAAKRRMAK